MSHTLSPSPPASPVGDSTNADLPGAPPRRSEETHEDADKDKEDDGNLSDETRERVKARINIRINKQKRRLLAEKARRMGPPNRKTPQKARLLVDLKKQPANKTPAHQTGSSLMHARAQYSMSKAREEERQVKKPPPQARKPVSPPQPRPLPRKRKSVEQHPRTPPPASPPCPRPPSPPKTPSPKKKTTPSPKPTPPRKPPPRLPPLLSTSPLPPAPDLVIENEEDEEPDDELKRFFQTMSSPEGSPRDDPEYIPDEPMERSPNDDAKALLMGLATIDGMDEEETLQTSASYGLPPIPQQISSHYPEGKQKAPRRRRSRQLSNGLPPQEKHQWTQQEEELLAIKIQQYGIVKLDNPMVPCTLDSHIPTPDRWSHVTADMKAVLPKECGQTRTAFRAKFDRCMEETEKILQTQREHTELLGTECELTPAEKAKVQTFGRFIGHIKGSRKVKTKRRASELAETTTETIPLGPSTSADFTLPPLPPPLPGPPEPSLSLPPAPPPPIETDPEAVALPLSLCTPPAMHATIGDAPSDPDFNPTQHPVFRNATEVYLATHKLAMQTLQISSINFHSNQSVLKEVAHLRTKTQALEGELKEIRKERKNIQAIVDDCINHHFVAVAAQEYEAQHTMPATPMYAAAAAAPASSHFTTAPAPTLPPLDSDPFGSTDMMIAPPGRITQEDLAQFLRG